jgi:hypothetical protein
MCCLCGKKGHFKRYCPLNFHGMNVRKSAQQPLIFGGNMSTMNSLLFAGRNVGHRCMQILLDSGAALSLIQDDTLDDMIRNH